MQKILKNQEKVDEIKGVILAAGNGDRIKNITYGAIPKELLPIGNVPTIRFPIESLKLAGVKDIFVVISPNGKYNLIQGIRSGRQFGVNVSYLIQEKDDDESRGIGKAILSSKKWIGEGDFLVACGDTILCNFSSPNPFDCLSFPLKIHMAKKPIATIVLYPTKTDAKRFGVAKFRKLENEEGLLYGEIERLIEKPSITICEALRDNGFNYIIAGYYFFSPQIFSYIEKTEPDITNEVQITNAISLALNNGEKVYGVVHGKNGDNNIDPYEYWDVGIPEAYKEANRKLFDIDTEKLLPQI